MTVAMSGHKLENSFVCRMSNGTSDRDGTRIYPKCSKNVSAVVVSKKRLSIFRALANDSISATSAFPHPVLRASGATAKDRSNPFGGYISIPTMPWRGSAVSPLAAVQPRKCSKCAGVKSLVINLLAVSSSMA